MKLHDYQEVARDFLRGRGRAGLFLDMGLGKTLICLAALEPRHLPVLVLAPKRVAETVWDRERDKWSPLIMPGLKLVKAVGSPAERAAALTSDADVVVLSRDNQGDLERVKRKRPFRTLIIDELSGYKSHISIRYKSARKFIAADSVEHVWGLTGTPIPNGYLDLWSQIALLDMGVRLGKNITTYRNRYFTPGRQLPSGVVVDYDLRPEAVDNIKAKIADLCLSMESDGRIDLPGRVDNAVSVQLDERSKAAYREIQSTLVTDVRDVLGGEIHSATNAAVLSSKLSQIAAGFIFVDDADIRDSAYTTLNDVKIQALADIIDTATSPVLVFYRFRPELARLLAHFNGKQGRPFGRRITEPNAIADWDAGKIPLLFAHPASAAHGLNLQHGGHTIAWTSLTWSSEEWEQANARLLRQGQRYPVVIHTILADGTVDSVMVKRLVDKVEAQDDLMSHLESPI